MKLNQATVESLLADCSAEVTWVLNLTRNCFTHVSPSVLPLEGYTVQEAKQRSLEDAFAPESVQPACDQISQELGEFLKRPDLAQTHRTEVKMKKKNGETYWADMSRTYRFNQEHEIEMIGIHRCIDSDKSNQEQMEYLSYHDQLTGLFNRKFFEEECSRLDTPRNLPISIVVADINGLNLINYKSGIAAGDALLVRLAELLRKQCRSDDIIARTGGDEFGILLPKTDSETAAGLIRRISTEIADSQQDIDESKRFSVSFGWKTKTRQTENLEMVFLDAEEDLYVRKPYEGSRNRNDTMKLLVSGLFRRDTKEKMHSQRVSELCRSIGAAMGLDEKAIREVGLAGLYHDVGKVGIETEILHKCGKLTEEERKVLEQHPEIGYRILQSVSDLVSISEYIRYHHERPDGRGYPEGRQEKDIPVQSRIISVAEAFDLMTRSNQYKDALPVRDAINELEKNAGTQFDAAIAQVFVEKVLQEDWNGRTEKKVRLA